jgi:sarcosine oxidase subunit delta
LQALGEEPLSFTITCPVCGERDVYEFHFGGRERGPPPPHDNLTIEEYLRYAQFRTTRSEAQLEWWFHASGCGSWFRTWRNPANNREEKPREMSDE